MVRKNSTTCFIASAISNDCLKVFNLGDEKVILTVSFTPLET